MKDNFKENTIICFTGNTNYLGKVLNVTPTHYDIQWFDDKFISRGYSFIKDYGRFKIYSAHKIREKLGVK